MRYTLLAVLLALAPAMAACESSRTAELRGRLVADLAELFGGQGLAPAGLRCGLIVRPEEGTTCQFRASAGEVERLARGLGLRDGVAGRGVCSTESDLYQLNLMKVYGLEEGARVRLVSGRTLGVLVMCRGPGQEEAQVVAAYAVN